MVTPKIFEAFVDALADRELTDLIRHRLSQKDQALEVDIDTV
jgi:antitoxin StbD